MDDRKFDELIEQSRRCAIPPCPGNVESNVLRRIRLARERGSEVPGWIEWWLPGPALQWTALAVAVLASVGTSALAVELQGDDRPTHARVALGFDSFANPMSLPTDHE